MKHLYFLLVSLAIMPVILSCAKTGNEPGSFQGAYEVEKLSDPAAEYELGRKYYWGQGVARDNNRALKWFRKSAEQGNPEAQYALGSMYCLGDGVPQDYVLAYMWFTLAASGGNQNGAEGKAIAAGKLTQVQIEEARKLAAELKVTGANPE